MASSIVFYDIPSSLPDKAWSPNTWKTRCATSIWPDVQSADSKTLTMVPDGRYALNFKGLSYRTVWLEYPEIEPKLREMGAAPTRNKPDGRPHYTLPLIHDLSTGVVIAESSRIAAYLDATYPDTPRLMPEGTIGFHFAFEDAALALLPPIWKYAIPASCAKLNPVSEAYFRPTREATFGVAMKDMMPTGEADVVEWQKVKNSFGKMDGWIRDNSEGSVYLMGDAPCYADLWMAAYVIWIKLVLPEKFEDLKSWHDGRWAKLAENMAKYETIV
ncbi:Glutathione S-transferase-like protein ustS [Mycena venus]|uniref:Glutathione S-transferase-like protein ustS n=1 Tax=Mycena venus TaxID=2733690 RepID=A0A8H6YSV8_9AGAR|nr:Glutathione S-transferase-like protein ustS [Mycena venus]